MSATATTSRLRAVPSGDALGADVEGFDIANVSDADMAFIRQAWLDHLVLRFRGQDFDDRVHRDFSRRFGPLDMAPSTRFDKPWLSEFPEMSQITNIEVDGKPIGTLGSGELVWHTDMSYIDTPPTGSLLHALEIPSTGGETSFLNMYRAYETLPPDLKTAADTHRIKHDQTHNSSGALRAGLENVTYRDVTEVPGAVHPIARTHPETCRKALYLGRRARSYVAGLPVDESEALLDALWGHATGNPDFVWTQVWRNGDLILWDNRCVMHRREAFDPAERRLMHRTVLLGDRPY
jgi:taurine dioxygenase